VLESLSGETLVTRTARALAALSLEREDGAFLGAEDELLARFGVSRPTLRQAAKIAESDRLIIVRRGVRGGLYAARPDARDAIRTLTRFLRLRGATLRDITVVSRLVWEEAADLAAGCADEGLRARLDRFAAEIDAYDTPAALIRAETELARLVGEMGGNPGIELVMALGYAFGLEEEGLPLFEDPSRRATARKLQRDLCEAIRAREGDVARVMVRRRSKAIAAWLDAALEERP